MMKKCKLNHKIDDLVDLIIGSAIAPHGSLILPDTLDSASEAYKIHFAMTSLANHIEELKPEVIFLSTPHGVALGNSFGFYKNQKASGTAEWHGEYKEFAVSLNIDVSQTNSLFEKLLEKDHKIEGITSYTQTEPIYLRWGEVVPCWFLKDVPTNYIIMSQPSRRINHALDMIPELKNLGRDVGKYLDSIKERVFILISGDMAHTYQEDGPYGIHQSAQPFDDTVEKWAKTLEQKYLIEEAGSMVNTALACGFTGFVFVDALLKSLEKDITSEVLINTHPTYYGMMVATFEI